MVLPITILIFTIILYTAFILGLVGSFHCLGMCGPIAFVLPLDRSSKTKMLIQSSLYQIGRLVTYAIIGVLFGLIGKALYLAGFQQKLSVLIGILMILVVIIPVKVFNRFNFSKPIYKGIGLVKSKMGQKLKTKSNKTLFTLGLLNGLLPCGLVYMAVFGAVNSGDIFQGASYMFLFGLGTIPMMTAAVLMGNFLKVSLRNKIQKAIPIFVIVIGLLFILRGLGLGIPYVSPSDNNLLLKNNPEHCVSP